MSEVCRKCGSVVSDGAVLQPSAFGGWQDYEYTCACGFSEIYAFVNRQNQIVVIPPEMRIHWSGRPAMTH